MKNGFTLIELILAIVIIGLLMGIGVANFRDATIRQSVDGVARQIVSDLRLAQTDSSSGKKPSGCAGSFLGYRVDFQAVVAGGVTRSTQYTVNALCAAAIATKTVNLPTGQFVTLNKPPSGGLVSVTFRPLETGTDVNPASPLIITSSHGGTQRTIPVTVTAAGEIK